jgi:hypothetical protein
VLLPVEPVEPVEPADAALPTAREFTESLVVTEPVLEGATDGKTKVVVVVDGADPTSIRRYSAKTIVLRAYRSVPHYLLRRDRIRNKAAPLERNPIAMKSNAFGDDPVYAGVVSTRG